MKKLFLNKTRILILFILIVTILSGLLSIYFSYFHHYKGKNVFEEWNITDVFNEEDVVTLYKDPNKDFIILNLTDIQLCDIGDFFHRNIIKREIDYLIKETNPDLITLTGDQTWSNENLMSLKALVRWLDSYKIPYAPIFGNHDYGNDYNSAVASNKYCSDIYEKSKYCVYNRGPTNLGCLGNYVINIKEEDRIIKTLYMIDAGYNDAITDEQIKWIKWNALGIKDINGGNYSSGMIFMHKPIPMYRSAYSAYLDGTATSLTEVLVKSSLSGISDNGLYELAKEIGVDNFVCGHQHTNTFSIDYDDCTFTFALKTGELSYYYDDGMINYNGGTTFTINEDDVKIKNIYVDRDKYHIKNSENQFNE